MKDMPITMNGERIRGAGGLEIFVRSWRPETAPRAIVAICHGVNSHSGYYGWAAAQLVESGLAVYALDLHGRGQSDGERFYNENIEDYIVDVDALINLARKRVPGLPVFLLGHSAGGVVCCVYALEHQEKLAGLICESFAFQVAAPDIALSVVKGLAHIAPHAHVLHLNNADFSRDPDVVRAMNADPLIDKEIQSTKTVSEFVRATERLKAEFPLIKLPVLILHGTADKVTRPAGSQLFYDTAGARDKTLKLYDGHVHDLLNDYDREIVMTDIKRWIAERLPAVRTQAMIRLGVMPTVDLSIPTSRR
jgi:alpha-beta hydrolase superfamily lysophospholipase